MDISTGNKSKTEADITVIHEKMERLKNFIKSLESVAIAFSGGVDSTFLLKVAHDVLGENVLAITARSEAFPEREYREAAEFVRKYGIRHETVVSEELEIEGFADNPPDRCYLCKKELFGKIINIAESHGLKHVAEGSNYDDLSDYRPGMKAIEQLGIISPLREAMLFKNEIRFLSSELGLPTWNKPSFACLSSRFPYGEKITREKLRMIDKAEQLLIELGFRQVRVRHHGQVARIEIMDDDISKIISPEIKSRIYSEFKQIGFNYTALDLKGYRTGSMNEGLSGTRQASVGHQPDRRQS